MTGREIILANIEHDNPERIGLTFGPERIDDMVGVRCPQPRGHEPEKWQEGPIEYSRDVWGNVWHRMVDGSAKGEIFTPVLDDWDKLDDLAMPDYDDPGCWEQMKATFADHPDRFKLAGTGGWVFATARYMRKMEVYFMDMAQYPDELRRLHRKLADHFADRIRWIAQTGADGIMLAEDMGTQSGLLFSPAMWREYFADLYAELFGLTHELGMKVIMHSCGQNWQILPDLLKAGVDCFQFDQPAIYDMPALAGLLREHRASLWSPVDIQKVLPTGDRQRIEDGVRQLCTLFRGEFIAGYYGDLKGIGVKPEWDAWAYEAFLKYAATNN